MQVSWNRSSSIVVIPPKTLLDLINYAKEHPQQLNYGSVGIGSSQHLAGAYFEQLTGTQLVHVPYRNIANYTPDFISGQVPRAGLKNLNRTISGVSA